MNSCVLPSFGPPLKNVALLSISGQNNFATRYCATVFHKIGRPEVVVAGVPVGNVAPSVVCTSKFPNPLPPPTFGCTLPFVEPFLKLPLGTVVNAHALNV